MEPKAAISSDLIRGHIDTIILHTLLDGDKYAQQIIDSVELKSEKQYQLNQATLYSSLKRLESGGFVKSYWFDSEGGRRKYIKITEKGVNFVNENLTNWSFSRAIIDKLIDYDAPDQKQFKPVSIIKTTNKPYQKPVEKSVSDAPTQNAIEQTASTVNKNNVINEITKQQEIRNDIKYTPVGNSVHSETNFIDKKEEDVKEINFRAILSGLIKATAVTEQPEQQMSKQELKPNISADEPAPITIQPVQLKFNETISDENVIKREMKNYGGKIDFSDLVNNSEKEGIKVRVSSKNAATPKGKIYENKLRFFSVLLMCFFAVLEFFTIFSTDGSNILSAAFTVVFFSLLGIFLILSGIIYAKKPNKTLPKQLTSERIVTCAIVVFNALLITFALNFLLNVDFENKTVLYNYLVLPSVISIDCLLYFIVEYFLSKISLFKVKIKE